MSEYLTLSAAATALARRETTSTELVQHALSVADRLEGQVGAFVSRFSESALEAAAAADAAVESGAQVGPLHGIPLGIKDIITTQEGPTTAQSLVLDRAWGQGDAPVVARLRSAGGVMVGKTTTMEFACGVPDGSKPFPIPRNPWGLETWPGGSSSGTGSGVAAGMFLGGLGTDTGGSIRIPAAFCGISGLMPTFGRVPKSGCVPLGYSLDHIGPMARSAKDCALMLGVLAGFDPSDASCVDAPVGDYLGGLTGDLTGMRIGVDDMARVGGSSADPAVAGLLADALAALESRGAEIVQLRLPWHDEVLAALGAICAGEMAAYHAPDATTRWGDYFLATRSMIARGAFYSGADYVQAQRVRRTAQISLGETFADVDLIVSPTASIPAVPSDELGSDLGAWFALIHTAYWDAMGNPVISVPMGFNVAGLPLGLQIAGRPFDEATVLKAADAYQAVTDWHLAVPEMARIAVPA